MLGSVLLLLLLSCGSNAKYFAKCSNSTEGSFIFEPSDDDVGGRYKVEWCTQVDTNVSHWELSLRYNEKRSPEKCRNYRHYEYTGPIHSRQIEPVTLDLNCTNVCLSSYLDLIFNKTCYHVKTFLKRGQKSSSPHDSLHYVTNNYTKDHFTKSESRVSPEDYEDRVLIRWFLGYVPAADAELELCRHNSSDNHCFNIGANCTLRKGENEVVCELRRGALAPGCYQVWLKHRAAWSAGESLFRNLTDGSHEFCNKDGEVDVSDVGGVWAAVRVPLLWVGGAVSVAIAFLLLLVAMRSQRGTAMRRRVLSNWVQGDWSKRPGEPFQIKSGADPFPEPTKCGRVFLLYAHDCELFVRVVKELKLMLQKAGLQVVDVYGCDTLAASAAAGGDWVRQMVARPDTRLLLLQSPAAAALYTAQLGPGARPHLERPLLWERAVPRRPRGGDALLLLALRLLVEGAHGAPAPGAPPAYRKYYLAELAGLEADMFPSVTPLRRYRLPAAAPLLLRDLAGAPDPAGPGEGDAGPLAEATQRLLQFVRERPDYLRDELVFA